MKIAILFGRLSVGTRPLDFWYNNIYDSARGLTGSDLSCVKLATELYKLGNDIHLFTVHAEPNNRPATWENVKLYDIDERFSVIDNSFDAIICINDVNDLIGMPEKPYKICWEFLNDFPFAQPDYDKFIDLYLSPCKKHMDHVKVMTPSPHKWDVLALGCEPSWNENIKKVPGRMVFCSSADRGLHWALSVYPEIKKAVPEASLKVFYHFQEGNLLDIDPNSTTDHPHLVEMSNRLRYCKNAMDKMKHMGVEHCGSVSVNQMNKELQEASLLLFPVSTIAFSEGFSLAILGAHATGVIPAISTADCIGSIYKDSGCIIVDHPVENNLKEYTQKVIKALTDEVYANDIRKKCFEFAQDYKWSDIVLKMQNIILNKNKILNNKNKDLVKLNIASGPNIFPHAGWINYDREDISQYLKYMSDMVNTSEMPDHQKKLSKYIRDKNEIDFRVHDLKQGFPQHKNNSVDIITVQQAIEHLNPVYEIPSFLKECYRMLKVGGFLRLTTPDLDLLIKAYLNNEIGKFANEQPEFYKDADPSSQLAYLMYGSTGPSSSWNNYEGHMFLFTQKSMTEFLEKAGFRNITFYYTAGESKSPLISKEVVDSGMSHSFAVEAIK